MKLMFIDVKKAHLNGFLEPGELAYVSLPDGCCAPGRCGRLNRWLYGMRPAASAWEKDFTDRLKAMGFKAGKSAPTVFFDEGRGIRCVVHGDDFTFLGWEWDLMDVMKGMEKSYELKMRGVMGGEPSDAQEITILNRRLTWKGDVMTYEADSSHARKIWEDMGLEDDSKGLEKPVIKEAVEQLQEGEGGDKLWREESRKFRTPAARANYLALDRADIQYATKEVCRGMAAPTEMDKCKLKRLARYLVEYPKLVWTCGKASDEELETLHVYSDSDWAGCVRSRKSTSGGAAVLGGMALKSWSSTQPTTALSVGEAEYTALVKAATVAIGMRALASDLGWRLGLEIHVDSSTATSIASRSGIGKIRHLETKILWVQEAVKLRTLCIRKIGGLINPADVLT
jgi:hypothetical protein